MKTVLLIIHIIFGSATILGLPPILSVFILSGRISKEEEKERANVKNKRADKQ